MTSGTFTQTPIEDIIINRESRQRQKLIGLEELAESIRVVGLINPIVISDTMELVAGERRLTACRDILGWTHISTQYTSDCDPAQLHLIELEENVKRVDLDWQDQCRAVEEYHRLRASETPDWNASKTSKALGITKTEVAHRLGVAKALDEGVDLVVNADKYSTARNIVERRNQRANTAQLESISFDSYKETKTADPHITLDEELVVELPAADKIEHPFHHADFNEWASNFSGIPYNFLHCDFPYGVNADKHAQGAAKELGGYEDSVEVYWKLIDTLSAAMDNVVAPSAHMMFWFSMDFYSETKEALTNMGWKVNPFPLIWHKTDNTGILPDPKRGPRRIYETAFLCTRGDRFIAQAVGNTFGHATTKEIHMSEKSIPMLKHFFRMFVDESTLMLDPTMGSGNSVIASEEMGASYSLGLERDETFYTNAVNRYKERKTE